MFEDVTTNEREIQRFVLAFIHLKATAGTANDDWSTICGIHGGNLPAASYNVMKPIVEQFDAEYVRILGEIGGALPDGSFCAHVIPTFAVWHRPFMLAFETLLQKYDPFPGDPTPLALHYWAWDSETATPHGKLPDWATSPTILGFPNPFIQGPRDPLPPPLGLWAAQPGGTWTDPNDPDKIAYPTGPITARGGYPTANNGPIFPGPKYSGISAKNKSQAFLAQLELDYATAMTMNNYIRFFDKLGPNPGTADIENPHNELHNDVGGDMQNVATSSWDPIFWLHHSNVERLHTAWLERNRTVKIDTLMANITPQESAVPGLDMMNFTLFPFAGKDVLQSKNAYYTLPWKQVPTTFGHPREWLTNEGIVFGYDDYENIGGSGQQGHLNRLAAEASAIFPHPLVKTVILKNLPVRGAGVFKASIRVNDQVIQLDDKHLFTRPAELPCANCAAVKLTLVYSVTLNMRELPAGSTLSLESAVFYENRRAPVQVDAEVSWWA